MTGAAEDDDVDQRTCAMRTEQNEDDVLIFLTRHADTPAAECAAPLLCHTMYQSSSGARVISILIAFAWLSSPSLSAVGTKRTKTRELASLHFSLHEEERDE